MDKKIIEGFKSIAPYSEDQVLASLKWLETNDEFINTIQFFYPKWTKNNIVTKLKVCKSCYDFQVAFVRGIVNKSINETMTSFEVTGLKELKKPNNLIISNHRDIFLDSALLQNSLLEMDMPFTEISLGDNLIVNETMKAVAKLNSMYTVLRTGNKSEMLSNVKNLSNYLRYSITHKKVSSWIAQKNGRAKDGNDITAPGFIKMLLLSGGNDLKESIRELNIVVSTISYEYEPCAFEKATELSIIEKEGVYKKRPFENIYSLVNGIKDEKGAVKFVFEELNIDTIEFVNHTKKDVISVANEIDRIVYKNYQLRKTNYIAHDLLYNSHKFRHHYTQKEVKDFKKYLSRALNEDIYHRVLKMYVTPIHNKEKVEII